MVVELYVSVCSGLSVLMGTKCVVKDVRDQKKNLK